MIKTLEREKITIKHQVITPQLAGEMLELNVSNRPINRRHVETLSHEMSAGRWRLNGDAIRFSATNLIDGQHRLYACIKADVPFETFVVNGLNWEVFQTIDAGKQRSAVDTLALLNQPNASRLAPALRFVDSVETGTVGQRLKTTNTELSAMLEKYPDIHEAVETMQKEKTKLMPFGVAAGLLYLFGLKDHLLAAVFWNQLAKGDNLPASSPIYILRERLLSNATSRSKLPGEHLAAFTIKAWNAVRSGKDLKQLSWRREGASPEDFPEIL